MKNKLKRTPLALPQSGCRNRKLWNVAVLHVVIVMATSLVFLTSVYAEDKVKAKSELMALVGMRIPPEVPFRKQAELPGWHALGSFHVGSIKGYGEDGYIGTEGGFVIIQFDEDMTRTVLDARVLPLKLLGYDLKGGKHVWHRGAIKIYSVEGCEKAGTEDAIVGLMRPERGKEGCLHYSRQVKMAWRVNEKGKLEDISPKGVRCYFSNAVDECD